MHSLWVVPSTTLARTQPLVLLPQVMIVSRKRLRRAPSEARRSSADPHGLAGIGLTSSTMSNLRRIRSSCSLLMDRALRAVAATSPRLDHHAVQAGDVDDRNFHLARLGQQFLNIRQCVPASEPAAPGPGFDRLDHGSPACRRRPNDRDRSAAAAARRSR